MTKNIACIVNGKIILEHQVLLDKVLVFDEKILKIIDREAFTKADFGKDCRIIDANGKFVSPGFIDVHIHGAGGKDTMDGTVSDLETIGKTIAKNGVTGFLPTTLSMEKEKVHVALDAIGDAMKPGWKGAKVLGAHLEGPFLSPLNKGAHDSEFFQKANFEFVEDYLDVIKIITLAPERDPDFAFIKKLKACSDIVLSIGHTNGDYETVMKAITEGMSSATHLFNAMAPFHHRAPGPVGAVLNSEINFELIADNLHVHPAMYQILVNAKGYSKMILVTDAMRAATMSPGDWNLGGLTVRVDGDSARLIDGTLAGSVIGLNQAVSNILKHTDLNISEAVSLASINPARLLKLDKQTGSIEIGKNADLILIDEDIQVSLTILDGKIIHTSE